jgi:hypothetical protein
MNKTISSQVCRRGPSTITARRLNAVDLPVGGTAGPVDATAGPVDATAGPVDATAGPVDATAGPVDATHGPVDATAVPVEATSETAEATSGPVEVSAGQVEATDRTTGPVKRVGADKAVKAADGRCVVVKSHSHASSSEEIVSSAIGKEICINFECLGVTIRVEPKQLHAIDWQSVGNNCRFQMTQHKTICGPSGVWAPDSTALDIKRREPPGQQAEWAGGPSRPAGQLKTMGAAGQVGQRSRPSGPMNGPSKPVGRTGRWAGQVGGTTKNERSRAAME